MGNAGGEALGWIDFLFLVVINRITFTFYEMGNRLGINNIVEFAKKFGLGLLDTGIELEGELSGLLPTPENKKKIFPGEKLDAWRYL